MLLSLSTQVCALQQAPWFGNDNEFEWRTNYSYQSYDELDTKDSSSHRPSKDHFVDLGIGIASMGCYHGEISLGLASIDEKGKKSDNFLESISAQGRYLWSNDIVGDPFSVTIGASVAYIPSKALRKPSIIRHGNTEGELHLAIGKELTAGKTWERRGWGLAAFGVGNIGSPWLNGKVVWEENFDDIHRFELTGSWKHGLGGRSLDSVAAFTSFRSLNYDAADVKFLYAYTWDIWGDINFAYTRRMHAKYAPKDVDTLTLEVFVPFGL